MDGVFVFGLDPETFFFFVKSKSFGHHPSLTCFQKAGIQCLISKIDTVDSYPNCPRRARLERCLNFLAPAPSRAALDKRG